MDAFTGEIRTDKHNQGVLQQIREELTKIPEADRLQKDEDQLVADLLSKYRLEPLEIDGQRELRDEGTESIRETVKPSPFDRPRTYETKLDRVGIPLVRRNSNAAALRLHPDRWFQGRPFEHPKTATFREDDHYVIVRSPAGRVDDLIENVKRAIDLINRDIRAYAADFEQNVRQIVSASVAQTAAAKQRRQDTLQQLESQRHD